MSTSDVSASDMRSAVQARYMWAHQLLSDVTHLHCVPHNYIHSLKQP